MPTEEQRTSWRAAKKRVYTTTKQTERVRAYRQELSELLRKMKSVPCLDCGNTYDPECMDFDHRPGVVKLCAVSQMITRSRKSIEAEAAKCDVVCANCHRLRTKRRRLEKVAS